MIKGSAFDIIRVNPDDPDTPLRYVSQSADVLALPSHDEMLLGYQLFPESVPNQLADAAKSSVVSGTT